MNHILLSKKLGYVRATLSLIMLCFLLPQGGYAQGDDNAPSFRERLKQRLTHAQEVRQDREIDEKNESSLAGDHVYTLNHDGLVRTYRVHVPQNYRAARAVPLLFAFHGGSGDMEHMANDRHYGLISKSEAEGFIVVFPNGYSKLKSGKFASWNAGNCCANARDEQIDDVGFVRKMIAAVSQTFNINSHQIYATGMSNGGMMAYRLACEMSDTFKAIAAVAGTDNTISCRPDSAVSILHIHAANDDHVLFNGGAGAQSRDASKVTNFTSVPNTIDQWVQHNQCLPTLQRLFDQKEAFCEVYRHCQNNTQVQLCVTQTGGHSWPGGVKPRTDESPSQAISAVDVMWRFFSSQ